MDWLKSDRARLLRRVEPYVPAGLGALALGGLLLGGELRVTPVVLSVLLVGVSATALGPTSSRWITSARAWAVLVLGFGVAMAAGGVSGPVRFLPVIAAGFYPHWMAPRPAVGYAAAAAAGYLPLLLVGGSGSIGEWALWSTVTVAVGLISLLTGRALQGFAAASAVVAADARLAWARFTAAFETARSGMAILSASGVVLSANQALADFLGTARADLEGLDITSRVDVDADREWFHEHLAEVLSGEQTSFTRELRFRCDRGADDGAHRHRWGIVAASPITDEAESDTLFLQVHDVTSAVLAAEELRESEVHYRHLFGGSPVPTLELDCAAVIPWVASLRQRRVQDVRTYLNDRPARVREGVGLIEIADANVAAVALLEAEDQMALLGPILDPQLLDESHEALIELITGVAEGRAVASAQTRLRTRRGNQVDGMLRWVVPVQDGVHRTDRVIVSIIDLTDHKRAQDRLERVQNRLRTVVGAAPIVLFALDRFGVFTLAEGQGLNRLGIAPGEPVGRSVFEMFRDSPQLVRAVRRGTSGEAFTTTVEVRSLHFDIRFSPIWESGRVAGVIGVANDVTERQQATLRLEALVRTKDEFVAGVSHELRTPLTAVVGFATELRDNLDTMLPEDIAGYIDLIASQAMDVGDLVEDLLVAARVDMDRVAVFPEPLSIGDQIDGVLASWPDSSAAQVTRLGPPAKVFADPIRVRQILRNLLTNAQRYGGPHIQTVVEPGPEVVRIHIVDDGVGIPEAERSQIFEPYHRAHAAAGQPMSVGLGLTVSRQLARLMDGDLEYDYRDGQSTFTLTLPVVG